MKINVIDMLLKLNAMHTRLENLEKQVAEMRKTHTGDRHAESQ